VPTHDFWLVIKFPESSFELPLIPSQQMNISRNAGEIGYSIPSNEIQGASLLLRFPAPKDGVEVEEVQGLEDLLYQYGSLDRDLSALGGTPGVEPARQPADMRGKLVLMNEDSGQILGEFDQSLDIEEDRRVGEDGREKQPVVLDFGAVVNGQMVGEVVVKTVPEDELDDWMLRGAHFLRWVMI
jgi:spartin